MQLPHAAVVLRERSNPARQPPGVNGGPRKAVLKYAFDLRGGRLSIAPAAGRVEFGHEKLRRGVANGAGLRSEIDDLHRSVPAVA
jgi:hypothetical protein